eukprot:1143713-Pelagomonas_calceolata.AAC.7
MLAQKIRESPPQCAAISCYQTVNCFTPSAAIAWQDGPPSQLQVTGYKPSSTPGANAVLSSELTQQNSKGTNSNNSTKGSAGTSEKVNNSALGRNTDSRAPWPPTWAGLECLPGWRQV